MFRRKYILLNERREREREEGRESHSFVQKRRKGREAEGGVRKRRKDSQAQCTFSTEADGAPLRFVILKSQQLATDPHVQAFQFDCLILLG